MNDIWIPGVGFVPPHIRGAMKAIEEYDHELTLGLDNRTGNYVVLLDSELLGRSHPVLDLGPELPGHDEIKRKLYMSDTRRRGAKIVADVERANEKARARMSAETHEGAGEVAEAMDVALHKMKRHPTPRIFVPGKDF